jgi:predicted phosphodiesterase
LPVRIAVITDVHANLPALEAALHAIAGEQCAAIYHTGDVVGAGPYPAETLDRMLHTPNMHLLMGNHDEWLVNGIPNPRPDWMSDGEAAHHRWVREQIDPALRAVVAEWPFAVDEAWHGLPVTFTHYARDQSGTEFAEIIPAPVAVDLDQMFPDNGAALIFYGHNHLPSDVQGKARYVNPGSLGCSSEPHARFAILEIDRDGEYTVQQHVVPYDPTELFRQFEERQVPERDFILGAIFRQQSAI